MRVLCVILASLAMACVMSGLSLLYSRDKGGANSDLANSWITTKPLSSPDLVFSHPLPAQQSFCDPRMISWRRHSHGLPFQWLVRDHSPDGVFYYARLDVFYAIVSVITFFIPSLFISLSVCHFLPRSQATVLRSKG